MIYELCIHTSFSKNTFDFYSIPRFRILISTRPNQTNAKPVAVKHFADYFANITTILLSSEFFPYKYDEYNIQNTKYTQT